MLQRTKKSRQSKPAVRFGNRGIHSQFASDLNPEASEALDRLLEYFMRPNLTKTIRNKFAFHYDASRIRRHLTVRGKEESHYFVTARLSGNLFYSFAEKIRVLAIAHSANDQDAAQAVRTLYDELIRVHGWIDDFTRSVLPLIAKKCGIQSSTPFESEAITDMSTILPVVFVDEGAGQAARSLP